MFVLFNFYFVCVSFGAFLVLFGCFGLFLINIFNIFCSFLFCIDYVFILILHHFFSPFFFRYICNLFKNVYLKIIFNFNVQSQHR